MVLDVNNLIDTELDHVLALFNGDHINHPHTGDGWDAIMIYPDAWDEMMG